MDGDSIQKLLTIKENFIKEFIYITDLEYNI